MKDEGMNVRMHGPGLLAWVSWEDEVPPRWRTVLGEEQLVNHPSCHDKGPQPGRFTNENFLTHENVEV